MGEETEDYFVVRERGLMGGRWRVFSSRWIVMRLPFSTTFLAPLIWGEGVGTKGLLNGAYS